MSKSAPYRWIGLGGMLIIMIFTDALVDIFVQPEIPFLEIEHLIVGFISGCIGFGFMGLTAFLVRRLSKAEFDKEMLAQHFDYLSKYANDIVVLIDERTNIVEANDRALSAYGYTREEMKALNPLMLRIPEEREKFNMDLAIQNFTNGMIFESVHVRKDGTTFPVEVSSRIFTRGGTMFLQSIVRDITERKFAEDAIRRNRDQLRTLGAHMNNIREEERKILAREIHDQLGQELTAIKMNIAVLAARAKDVDGMSEKIRYIRQLVDSSIQSVRKISTSLRPGVLDELGLAAAIEWQVREFEKQFGITCSYENAHDAISVREGVPIALFRILQESLTNVAKHAQATHVIVTVEVIEKDLRLSIEDNGIGIADEHAKKKKTFGILGMKERVHAFGGTVSVVKCADAGTRIIAHVPGAIV